MSILPPSVVLPPEITQFERAYLRRINRIALLFFVLHVPAFTLVAWANQTRPLLAAVTTSAVLVGPMIAYHTISNPRSVSVIHGISAMFMGGLLVHFGQGPAQIEMHFYFFAVLAMCSVFGNPMVIIAATVTVTLHHVLVWLVMPSSVFNYAAEWWVVGIHALFVVLEAFAACFIARSFFDNVIGLERIVHSRTIELDTKNHDMRMLLDNVYQGFMTVDRTGRLASERSKAIESWFGAPADDASLFDYLSTISQPFALSTRVGWEEVVADVMPLEVTLAQMPKRLSLGSSHYDVEYRPIGTAELPQHFLVIVSDMSEHVRSERADEQRREVMSVFQRVLTDRTGVEAFFEDGTSIMRQLASRTTNLVVVKRLLHTLKGNAALYGLSSIAVACHALEDTIAETRAFPPSDALAALQARWSDIVANIETLLKGSGHAIEIDETQFHALEMAARAGDAGAMLGAVRSLKLEPAERRLRYFAEQTQRITTRLDKPAVHVEVEDRGVRLEPHKWAPFWSAFIHAVRNALDHGIEPPDERPGKPSQGKLSLRSRVEDGRVVIEVEDDGRGIDWEGVRTRALRDNIPCGTPEELQAALFADGVSTARQVTEISGRGLGMGVLLDATRTLGGEIAVISQTGNGTLIRMTFPSGSEVDVLTVALAS